jgi:predicted transcriptional regulator of viral defense system
MCFPKRYDRFEPTIQTCDLYLQNGLEIVAASPICILMVRYAGLRLRTPPVKIYRFDVPTFGQGIEVHAIDRVPVRIYGVARTLVDCFKYRNKLGLDVAIEALRFARARKRVSNREILQFAQLLRQDRVMAPYLESVT